MELELATNQELMSELTNRSTFLGVIVAYNENLKVQNEIHFEDFKIMARGIPPEIATELFKYISEGIQGSIDGGDIIYHEEPNDDEN